MLHPWSAAKLNHHTITADRRSVDPTKNRGDLLELLSDVAMLANLTRDPESALVSATERICLHTGWDVGHAFTVEEDETLESTGVWHLEKEVDLCTFGDDTLAEDFTHGQGIPGRVVRSGRAVSVPDLLADHDFRRQRAARESGLRSAFAFPVLIGTRVVAVLEFFSSTPVTPDEDLLDTMGRVGVQLGRVFEREEARLTAERNEREVRQILDSAGDAYIATDEAGVITEWNRTAETMFGWSRSEALGRDLTGLVIPPEYREAHTRGVERFLMTGEPRVLGEHLELSALHRDGHEFPIDITMWAQRTVGGWGFYAFVRDISARAREERERVYRAQHDQLTGLPNHTTFIERVRHEVEHAPPRSSLTVFAIEIDQLNQVTDGMGQEAGDLLLATVARRILGVVRAADIVARAGGGSLLVLCGHRDGDGFDPLEAGRRFASVLSRPVRLNSDRTFVSVSVGIATTTADPSDTEDSPTPENLMASATAALREAQHSGHGSLAIFDQEMLSATTRRIRLEADLGRALQNHELELYYQPLVDARSGVTTGVESLLRWHHPEEGMVPPTEFIPIAERTGLIVPIGRWVIEEAIRQAQRWQDSHERDQPLKIAVNLSGRQLAQADLVETIGTALDRATLDPEKVRIAFEVTESLLMDDPDEARSTLTRLRALGSDISMDDFGTGYSSLAYLKRFPVQTLKVDRSFVINIASDPADRAIAAAVVELAHALGMDVVAEGVETEAQYRVIRDLGVDTIQGYLFSRPLPAAELDQILFGRPFRLPGEHVAGTATGHTGLA